MLPDSAFTPAKIEVYTDGSVDKFGFGGWAFVKQVGGKVITQKFGGFNKATNNMMELMAAVKALGEFKVQDYIQCVNCYEFVKKSAHIHWCPVCKGTEFRTKDAYKKQLMTWTRLAEPTEVVMYCDSKYVINGITDWVYGWSIGGWKSWEGGEVKNKDLWQQLMGLNRIVNPSWVWVPGHANVKYNEMADYLANQGRLQQATKVGESLLQDVCVK